MATPLKFQAKHIFQAFFMWLSGPQKQNFSLKAASISGVVMILKLIPTRRARLARRPAVAGAAAFSKKADVVFSYIHRESLMLICRGNLFRTKLGT